MNTPPLPNKEDKPKNGLLTAKDLTKSIFEMLPKADLHRHLDGSVRVKTIVDLAIEQNIKMPSLDPVELEKHIKVTKKKCESLVDYLEGFGITLKVMQKAYAITRIMYEVCEDAVADGIKYLEVRFSPILHTEEGLALSEVMEAICEGQFMAETNLPISVGIIVSGMRQMPPHETEKLAEITWRYRRKGVVGFDLAGPELGFSSKMHQKALRVVRVRSINATLHAGEAAGASYVKDAIMHCGAHRLGHGVRLYEDPELMQLVADRRIPLEVCVTSNEQTKAVEKAEDHPLPLFLSKGILCVPCTDNTTVSDCTLSEEYERITKMFNIDMYNIIRMLDTGFRVAFVDNTLKQRLRVDCLRSTYNVLKDSGFDTAPIRRFCRDHQFELGLDLEDMAPPYWKSSFANPPITEAVIRSIPKTDLHCRLCGSVSIEQVWDEIKRARKEGDDLSTEHAGGYREPFPEISSLNELRGLCQGKNHSAETINLAKKVFYAVLQNKGELERAVSDIIRNAADDNVKYIDIMIRPTAHTRRGLTAEEALDTVLDAAKAATAKLPIKAGVVVYASPKRDDPLVFRSLAELAVARRDANRGVVGFGMYGDEDLPASNYDYFASTFTYLKSKNMNIGIGAGRSDVSSIIEALHTGGAWRLSGAFQVHRFPRLMGYLASHRIPLEMRISDKFDEATAMVKSYLDDHPIRLYMDNKLMVTPCSFALSLYATTRSQFILGIIQECHLTISDTLRLMSNGFQCNFLHYGERLEMHRDFWRDSTNHLSSLGFRFFYNRPYFKVYAQTVLPAEEDEEVKKEEGKSVLSPRRSVYRLEPQASLSLSQTGSNK